MIIILSKNAFRSEVLFLISQPYFVLSRFLTESIKRLPGRHIPFSLGTSADRILFALDCIGFFTQTNVSD